MSNNNQNNSGNNQAVPVAPITIAPSPMVNGGYITWNGVGNGWTIVGAPVIYPKDDLAVPVKKKKDKDGEDCKKCKVYYQYAEPNQPDGTLICWACRNGY